MSEQILKKIEKVGEKVEKANTIGAAVLGVIAHAWHWLLGSLGFLVLAAVVILLIGSSQFGWFKDGVPFSSGRWTETMSTEEYVREFERNDVAEQFAPQEHTTIDGSPVDQLYDCYMEIGGYNAPPVQALIAQYGEPIIWDTDPAFVPAVAPFGMYDLSGRQVRLYVQSRNDPGVTGNAVIAAFQCPINDRFLYR